MITSDLIKAIHLSLLAVIYIRQSSPHQALTNQESLRLQYALKQLCPRTRLARGSDPDHRLGSGPNRQHHRRAPRV